MRSLPIALLARCAGLSLLAAATVATAAETTWRIQVWGPKRASTSQFEGFAKEVAAKTNGQLKFDLAWDKGKATESAELMKSGGAEGTYFCAQYVTDKMPLVSVLDLPMLAPENLAVLGRVQLALADHPAVQAELAKWNTKLLLPTPMPQYQMMGTRRVEKIEDLKGAKVRIAVEMGKVLTEYGAQVSAIPSTEAAAALRAGTLDLVALPYPYSFVSFKIADASKYVTEKISLGAPFCFLGVSQKAWDALPPAVQKTVNDLRAPTVAKYADAYKASDEADIASFKAKGLEFVTFNPSDRARLIAKAVKAWSGWVDEREAQGVKGREIFEFTQARIREYGRK